jgi:hypothetical protein
MTDTERNTIAAQLASLDDINLRLKTNGLRDMIEAGKVPAAKVDAAREMLDMAWAERHARGI